MVNGWRQVRIGDLCLGIFDGPHATPKKTEVGPIFLGISCLANGRVDLAEADHLSEQDFKRWTRRVLPSPGDLVFSYETKLGEAALIPEGLQCCLGRRMALARPNSAKVIPRFLLYAFLSPNFQEFLRSRTVHGSTVDRIPLLDFPNFPISVPAIETQQRIATLLGSLDDKIDLNRRMNATLDAMARALFRSWFVDFDPVRAKSEGRRPFGLDNSTTALFPEALEESPLGQIPRGWAIRHWGELVTLEYGRSLRSYEGSQGPFVVFGTNGPIGRHDVALCRHPGIVVGRKGAYRGIHYHAAPFFVIDTGYYVEPKGETCLRWAYYQMLREDINGMDSGSAIPSTSREDFYRLTLVEPPSTLQRQFSEVLSPMWTMQKKNEDESNTLAALRDALLPKLLSGEIRIQDAEALASPVR